MKEDNSRSRLETQNRLLAKACDEDSGDGDDNNKNDDEDDPSLFCFLAMQAEFICNLGELLVEKKVKRGKHGGSEKNWF